MVIVFFSNVLNHHQVTICDELHRLNNGNFYFVETGALCASRKSMGFRQFERTYLIRIKDGKEHENRAIELAINADVAIMGAESFPYLKLRINSGDKLTFSYSERWLKQGLKNILSRNLLKLVALYVSKGHRRKWFMLAANGFLANDLHKIGIFKNRIYKWGYFPDYSNSTSALRSNNPVKILWVGRLIDWKHPELMIDLAKDLFISGHDFELTMIGDGAMKNNLISMIAAVPGLSQKIKLKGNKPNSEVIAEMGKSDIYCFTSNRREGWGAVLGEAMATGCCPLASSEAGATPFLVKEGINGLVFNASNSKDFIEKVIYLIDNPEERQKMGNLARKTMLTEWNAETAAREFLSLVKIKLNDATKSSPESTLPASPAHTG